ncbi:MAG: hypothetical protein WC781_04575 [Candidatus Pacearchaeota archaeon]|jgi:hypothetical protein
MNIRENNVAFISMQLKNAFDELERGKFEDRQLYDFLNRAIDDLKGNPLCAIRIPKSIWPKKYIQNYEITNLWKYNLPNAWRLIYTIESNDIKIVSILLDWMSHKDYERLFNF